MNVHTVATDKAPAAIGPYSQAIVAGDTIYVSGQIPLDPQTGELVSQDVAVQIEQTLKNMAAVLNAAGSAMDCVVKVEVFLKDMTDFPILNEIYGKHFAGSTPPARQAIEAARLPKDVLVEISCVAVKCEV